MDWQAIIGTVLTLLITVGIPAYIKIRRGDKSGDVAREALDRAVALMADEGKLDEARSIQGIARTAFESAGAGVKAYNDARLKRTRAKSPLDVSALLAEAERLRAAREGAGG